MAAVTRLGLYGGPRGLYGSFAGRTTNVVVAAATAGVGKRRRYPRWVVINGQRYRVDNAAEEARLLSAMADRAADDAKLAEALGDAAVAEVARKRAVRIRRRLTDTRKREDEWLAHLRAEDEELIALLH